MTMLRHAGRTCRFAKSAAGVGDDEITIFDSTGTAIQDVAAAVRIYERAKTSGRGLAATSAAHPHHPQGDNKC
jgi:ornithine cyclodeaminase/alanine dehydrogenase-like protein (mu-crystallin family)